MSTDCKKQAYEEGEKAAREGQALGDNPYPESGHERDTTYEDELHQAWYSGFLNGLSEDAR